MKIFCSIRFLPSLLGFVCMGVAFHTVRADESQALSAALRHSRHLATSTHLIAKVSLVATDGSGAGVQYQYDRYPDSARIESPQGTFARRGNGPWLISDDWGKTGTPVPAAAASDLNGKANLVMVPLSNQSVSSDSSQGAHIVKLLEHENRNGSDWFLYETTREHPTGAFYPTFTFVRCKGSPADALLLMKFRGPMRIGGVRKMNLAIDYDYLISMKADIKIVPAPAPQ